MELVDNKRQNLVAVEGISEQKKDIIKNLYLSDIPKEAIALQLDLEISLVEAILEDLDEYEDNHSTG